MQQIRIFQQSFFQTITICKNRINQCKRGKYNEICPCVVSFFFFLMSSFISYVFLSREKGLAITTLKLSCVQWQTCSCWCQTWGAPKKLAESTCTDKTWNPAVRSKLVVSCYCLTKVCYMHQIKADFGQRLCISFLREATKKMVKFRTQS